MIDIETCDQERRDHRIEAVRARCKRKAERQYHVGDQQGFIHSCYRIQRLNRMRRSEVVERMDNARLERCKRRRP